MRSRWLRYGIGLILSMQGAFAQERDLAGVLRNDKESVSREYSRRGLHRAKERMGSISDSSFKVLLFVMGSIGRTETDPEVFSRLMRGLSEIGVQDPEIQLHSLLVLWRDQNGIDDVLFRVLSQKGEGLNRYFRMIQTVKNRSVLNPASVSESGPNLFSSEYKNKRHRLTHRVDLYTRFTSTQILLLSDVLKHLMIRLEATRAKLVFTYPNSEDAIDLSPMGQYYFARKLLLKEMQDLNRSTLFQGVQFGFEEVIAAALETGLVNGRMLSEVLRIDDLWNPFIAPWEKVTSLALRVSGSATVFLPPPFNVVSSLAILVIEGMIQSRHRVANQGRDGYDPF